MAAANRDLLLISLGGTTFGVWEEDIASVTPARPLYRLPLSPPAVAGMAIIDDKGATLFDIGACLGIDDRAERPVTRFLMMRSEGEMIGFCVSGAMDTRSCSGDEVVDLPKAVQTDVVGTCLASGGTVIPVINIRRLQERLLQGILDIPEPEFSGQGEKEEFPGRSMRFVSLGGAVFGVRGEGNFSVLPPGTPVTALPYARRRATGVVFHDNAVIPVVTVWGRIGVRGRTEAGGLLVVRVGNERYAISVDEDRGAADRADSAFLPLPPIARTAGIREAVTREGSVIPILDASVIMRDGEAEGAGDDLPAAYSAESSFAADFQRRDVEIAEFSLLGNLHGLPKEEVKEVMHPLPYRPLSGVPEIVIGVAALGNRLLPVLDLATIFGRRTVARPESRMLRLVNGDFEALVLVEAAGGIRELPRDLQRKVPITLPYEVLYGCYLDGRAVRLIMNVLALAVHFERTEIRELVAGLAPPVVAEATEVARRPAAAVGPGTLPASAGEPPAEAEQPAAVSAGAAGADATVLRTAGGEAAGTGKEQLPASSPEEAAVGGEQPPMRPSAEEAEQREDEQPAAVSTGAEGADGTVPSAAGGVAAGTGEEQLPASSPEEAAAGGEQPQMTPSAEEAERRPSATSGTTGFERTITAAAAYERAQEREALQQRQAAEKALQEEARKREEEAERARKEQAEAEEARLREEAEAQAREKEEAASRAEAEQVAEEARMRAEAEARERAGEEKRAEDEARLRREEEERMAAEAAERARSEEEAERLRKEERERRAAEEKERQEQEAAAAAAREKRDREEQEERARAAARFQEVVSEEIRTAAGGGAQQPAVPGAHEKGKPSRRRSLAAAAVIAALLVLLFYWAGGPSKQAPPTAGGDGQQQQEPQAVSGREPSTATVGPKQQREPDALSGPESDAPLVLDVPDSMPGPGMIVYVVVKGDTLWDLSERFTGNPFNYPRVAKDNSISTPDLIFPGQRIRLRERRSPAGTPPGE